MIRRSFNWTRFLSSTKELSKKEPPSSLITKDNLSYPWLLSTMPYREGKPKSLFKKLLHASNLQTGVQKASRHFHYNAYPFPEAFEEQAKETARDLLIKLSDPESATSVDSLREIMIKTLAEQLVPEHVKLANMGAQISFEPRGPMGLADLPIKIKTKLIRFVYGPYPVPHGYTMQIWADYLILVIPEDQNEFHSYTHQVELERRTMEEGVYMRVDTEASLDVDFVVKDHDGQELIRDHRPTIDLQFVSPHFTPWDEIFALQPDGNWKLAFDWKISDIDYLLNALPTGFAPSINWTSPAEPKFMKTIEKYMLQSPKDK
jgi:hypothetical protein